MEKELALSTAYGTWVLENDEWVVRDKDANQLWTFPKNFGAKGTMSAIRLGRKFELEAFNIGIAFGKSEKERMLKPLLDQQANQITILEQMNIKLSTKLEKFIIGDGEGNN